MKNIIYLFLLLSLISCGSDSTESPQEITYAVSNRAFLTKSDSLGFVGTNEEININIVTKISIINNSFTSLTATSAFLPNQFPSLILPTTYSSWIIPVKNIGAPSCYENISLFIHYSDNSTRKEDNVSTLKGSSFIVNGTENYKCLTTNEIGYITGSESTAHDSNIYITGIELVSITNISPTNMPEVTWTPYLYNYYDNTMHVDAQQSGSGNKKNYFGSYILFDDLNQPIYSGTLSNISSNIPIGILLLKDDFFTFRGLSNKVEIFIYCSRLDC